MAAFVSEASIAEQLQAEVVQVPPEHLPNLLQIVRAFRESVVRLKHIVLTANMLLSSDIVGAWREREDISDSAEYARALREQAQHRRLV